jgi:hypothetical protein
LSTRCAAQAGAGSAGGRAAPRPRGAARRGNRPRPCPCRAHPALAPPAPRGLSQRHACGPGAAAAPLKPHHSPLPPQHTHPTPVTLCVRKAHAGPHSRPHSAPRPPGGRPHEGLHRGRHRRGAADPHAPARGRHPGVPHG